MNAVERLLAHVEQIVSLFDEMCRELDEQEDPEWLVGKTPSVFFAPPWNHHWYIHHWWKVASVAADYDAPQASEMLRDRLAKRERLLDHATLHALVADVVRECRAWDFLAEDVVRAAEAVADNALDIERLSRDWLPSLVGYEWQSRRDAYVLHNIGMLRRLAQPQAGEGSSPKQQHSSSGARGTGSREGVGGNPGVWSREMKRQILSDHERHLKTCKRQKQKPLKQTAWVTQWATESGRTMSRKDALRLWEAAKRQRCRDRKKRR